MLKTKILKHLPIAALIGIGTFLSIQYCNVTAQQKNGLRLISSHIEYNTSMTEIKGQIKNNAKQELYYTDITFNLYDPHGNKIGSVVDNSGNLKAGETWNFDAIGPLKNFSTYKLIQLMGY